MVGICPEVLLFIFTRYISNTLALQKNREDSALSWGLPFGFLISPIFLEGVPKGSGETFERIYTRPGFDTPFRYSQQLSLLFLGSRLSGHFFGIFFWGNIGPVVSFWKGIHIFWMYCFARARNVLGFLVPALFFFCLRWRRYPQDLFPALWQAYFGIRLSSCYVRRRE